MPNNVNKITPYSDGKRRRMRMTKLTAVALTAQGANPEAHVTFFKSKVKPEQPVDKGGDLATLLTGVTEGHQHAIRIETYDDELYLDVGFAIAPGSDGNSHYHAIVMDDSGSYVIATNAGHTHEIDTGAVQSAILNQFTKSCGDTITKEESLKMIPVNKDGTLRKTEDTPMPDPKLQADLDAANKEIGTLKAKLAQATAYGLLSDTEKKYHDGLNSQDQESFLGKSSADRRAELEAAEKADPIEYTAIDGTEYRKSAGATVISMAKRLDEQDRELAAQKALSLNATFAKRADSELPNLKGDQTVKVALLRAISQIDDEETRKSIDEMLASANTTMEKVVTTIGTTTSPAHKSSDDVLDDLVAKYAKDNGVDLSTAYAKVLDTREGQAAYNARHN